jgi:hypothetical protein
MAPDVEAQEFVGYVVLACSGENQLDSRADVGGGVYQRAVDIEQIDRKLSQAG